MVTSLSETFSDHILLQPVCEYMHFDPTKPLIVDLCRLAATMDSLAVRATRKARHRDQLCDVESFLQLSWAPPVLRRGRSRADQR